MGETRISVSLWGGLPYNWILDYIKKIRAIIQYEIESSGYFYGTQVNDLVN